jgi:hypothetical protein
MHHTFKLLLILLLGGWLGAQVFFSFVAAPALFQLAKQDVVTREQAGDVAEAFLKRYFLCGLVALVLATALGGNLAYAAPNPRFTRCAMITLLAALVTAYSAFLWTPKVHALREQRRAHPGLEVDKQFRTAHHVSFGMTVLVIAGTAVAFVLVAKPE